MNPLVLPNNSEKQVVVTKEIKLHSFTGIKNYTSANIEITEGEVFSIVATGPEKIVDQIEKEKVVNDNILTFRYKQVYLNTRVNISITMPSVQYLENVGTGKMVGQNTFKSPNLTIKLLGTGPIDVAVDAEVVDVDLIGTGNVILKGNTSKLFGTIKGTGNILAFDLKSTRAGLWNFGTGNTKAWVTSNLECEIPGTGSIYYVGSPTIQSKINGPGELINAN